MAFDSVPIVHCAFSVDLESISNLEFHCECALVLHERPINSGSLSILAIRPRLLVSDRYLDEKMTPGTLSCHPQRPDLAQHGCE